MSDALPFQRVVNVRTLPRKGREERHVATQQVGVR